MGNAEGGDARRGPRGPAGCRPILVTDAGFRGPWFRDVEALGWHWVGRVRNTIKYYNTSTKRWSFVGSLYRTATPRVRHIGEVQLSKRLKYKFRLYLVRADKPRVGRPPRRGPKGQATTMYRRLHRAPWLLATSLPRNRLACRRVKQLYTQRMQNEETFRDLKSHRHGFGLRYARCRSAARLEQLLLIGTLAALVLWLVGLHASAKNQLRHFQANTVRNRRVLSIPFLGQQIMLRPSLHPPGEALKRALSTLTGLVRIGATP